MAKRSTITSAFGVSKRESHDAAGFYDRFTPPVLSSDSAILPAKTLDKLIVGDSRSMSEVADASVALVVTSPPYFAGKAYEETLGQGGVPSNYLEYLEMLRDVLAECVRTLEPGGRIAVNVANLGRRPYRSLSADVIGILQDDLRLLLRGEVIWLKQRGSSGSCAWGSFQRPGNPVLRDLTERIIIASKGRFDRALLAREREGKDLPSEITMTREDFMENTLDVWEIPPESATRVGHPAPFPVELPSRLIGLFTYRDDLVLDPFCGSGTTAVAAIRGGRHYVGYDLDESYIKLAETRVADERLRLADEQIQAPGKIRVSLPAIHDEDELSDNLHSQAIREGKAAKEIARIAIAAGGFTDIQDDQRQPGGIEVNFSALDQSGNTWFFDVAGGFTTDRAGLKRTDTLWKALGKAAVLVAAGSKTPLVAKPPFVLLTTDVPAPGSAGAEALDQACGIDRPIHAVVEMLNPSAPDVLRNLSKGK